MPGRTNMEPALEAGEPSFQGPVLSSRDHAAWISRSDTAMSKRKPHLFEIDQPLPPDAFTAHAKELGRLQGNILKAHGRDAEVHLLLTFKPRKQKEAKQFLSAFARRVTSAAKQ